MEQGLVERKMPHGFDVPRWRPRPKCRIGNAPINRFGDLGIAAEPKNGSGRHRACVGIEHGDIVFREKTEAPPLVGEQDHRHHQREETNSLSRERTSLVIVSRQNFIRLSTSGNMPLPILEVVHAGERLRLRIMS